MQREAIAQQLAGLYAVTPDSTDTEALLAKVAAAIAGGAAAVQYRNKLADAALRLEQAARLRVLCRDGGALLIVNDDPALAVEVDADGVHVGEDDMALEGTRRIVGARRLVGVSCYADLERARNAVAAGADYVAFGSLYPSRIKPTARRATLDLVREARHLDTRRVGIGGIDAGNATEAIAAGLHAVAVISAVFDAPDVEAAARDLAAACARGARAARDAPA